MLKKGGEGVKKGGDKGKREEERNHCPMKSNGYMLSLS